MAAPLLVCVWETVCVQVCDASDPFRPSCSTRWETECFLAFGQSTQAHLWQTAGLEAGPRVRVCARVCRQTCVTFVNIKLCECWKKLCRLTESNMFCWIWRLHHICLLFLTQLNIKSCLRVFHGLSIIKCKVKGARCSFSVWPLAGSKPSSYWCAHHAQATILILIRRKAPLSPTVSAYRKQKLCFGAFRRIILLNNKDNPPTTILLFFKKGQVMQFCLLMHIIVMKKGWGCLMWFVFS